MDFRRNGAARLHPDPTKNLGRRESYVSMMGMVVLGTVGVYAIEIPERREAIDKNLVGKRPEIDIGDIQDATFSRPELLAGFVEFHGPLPPPAEPVAVDDGNDHGPPAPGTEGQRLVVRVSDKNKNAIRFHLQSVSGNRLPAQRTAFTKSVKPKMDFTRRVFF